MPFSIENGSKINLDQSDHWRGPGRFALPDSILAGINAHLTLKVIFW